MPTIFISEATLEMCRKEIQKEVDGIQTKIEKALIYGIIKQESCFGQFTIRYEPGLRTQDWYIKCLKPEEKGYSYSYCSAGPMQVLLGIARSQGYTGSFEDLMKVSTNIQQGVKLLETLSARYRNIKDVISAYNQGNNGFVDLDKDKIHDPGEPYYNEKYVTNVYNEYKRLGGGAVT